MGLELICKSIGGVKIGLNGCFRVEVLIIVGLESTGSGF